jgi:hypothetical protein
MERPLFLDEYAVADGMVVIANGKLTPDAIHSPTMQNVYKLLSDKPVTTDKKPDITREQRPLRHRL